jgi:hypothetical protein
MQNDKLIFTRVSQAIDDAIPAVIAGNVEQEIINTMEYLKRLEFRDNAELEATVIVSQDVIESLDLSRFNFGRVTIMSPLSVAETLGLEQAALSADRFGDVVLGAAFGMSKKHTLRFSNAYIEKLSKIYKAHMGLRAVAALVIVVFLGLAGTNMLSAIDSNASIVEARDKHTSLKPELDKFKRSVDGLNKDVAFKSAVAGAYDMYIGAFPTLEDSLVKITPLMSSQQRVVAMAWDLTGSEKGGAANTTPAATGGEKLPLDIKLDIDFSAAGNTSETLDVAANALRAAMQLSLKEYDVTAEAFPWQKEEGQATKISLDQVAGPSATISNAVVVFRLRGIKKVSPSPVGSGSPAPISPAAVSGVAP